MLRLKGEACACYYSWKDNTKAHLDRGQGLRQLGGVLMEGIGGAKRSCLKRFKSNRDMFVQMKLSRIKFVNSMGEF